MRALGVLLLLFAANAMAMNADEARHLLLRTSFCATDAQIQSLQPQAYDEAIDHLVAEAARHTQAQTPPPSWVDDPMPAYGKLRGTSPEEKKAFIREQVIKGLDLQGWWMREMVNSSSPLTEEMTLFWHNHFTSSFQKVKLPLLLYRQNVTLRRYALGNFRDFLHAVARDPAMILYLDNQTNRDEHANENFARELMELFTLGIGHYSEDDVKETARAFTGWSIKPKTGEFHEARRWHDDGEKSFLGHHGNFDGDDIVDIILQQPQTADFIVAKLWRAFVSPTPDPAQVEQLAAHFRKDYEIAPLMAALLKTPQFRDRSDDGTLTKSPIDLVAGSLRSFGVTLDDGRFPAVVSARLGQALFNPPNVKGWPGGDAWIDSQTLLARRQFLDSMSRGFNFNDGNNSKAMMAAAGTAQTHDAPIAGTDILRKNPNAGGTPKDNGMRAQLAREVLKTAQALDMERYLGAFAQSHTLPQAEAVLLAVAPVQAPKADADHADQLRALLLDPAYQVK